MSLNFGPFIQGSDDEWEAVLERIEPIVERTIPPLKEQLDACRYGKGHA